MCHKNNIKRKTARIRGSFFTLATLSGSPFSFLNANKIFSENPRKGQNHRSTGLRFASWWAEAEGNLQ
jgi:hypothetical protein